MRKQKWEVHRCNSIRTFLYPLSARFGAGTFSILYKKTKKVNDNSDTRRETPFLSTLRNCSVTCLRETHSFFECRLFCQPVVPRNASGDAFKSSKECFLRTLSRIRYMLMLDLDFPSLSASWEIQSSLEINSIFIFQVNYNVC